MDKLELEKYIPIESLTGDAYPVTDTSKKLYVETYGCQMNFADTEIVNGIMGKNGYDITFN